MSTIFSSSARRPCNCGAASLIRTARDVNDGKPHWVVGKVREAIDTLRGLTSEFERGACAMYALELEIPAIAKTKLEGLESLYGIREDSALAYFREHQEADVRHAATWRGLVAESANGGIPEAIERSLDAQHRLLDGCHRVYC